MGEDKVLLNSYLKRYIPSCYHVKSVVNEARTKRFTVSRFLVDVR